MVTNTTDIIMNIDMLLNSTGTSGLEMWIISKGDNIGVTILANRTTATVCGYSYLCHNLKSKNKQPTDTN